MSDRWTHADGTTEHKVIPQHNASGWMYGAPKAYWICQVKACGKAVLLDGQKPPVATEVER